MKLVELDVEGMTCAACAARIEKNLNKLDESTGDADVDKAVDHMNSAVEDAQKAVDAGREPDVRPVGKAADELTKVCTG